jgi:peptidoglycan/LPS O-acetylase OafA/YrhL
MKPQPDRTVPSVRFGGRQIHSLTALRGIAAWWVVLFHFDAYLLPYIPASAFHLVSKGYLAVDLFFCLSGFVIFLNYGNLNIANAREICEFYFRRLAKIYPLHLFTIGLYTLLMGALLLTHRSIPAARFSGESLLLNLFLVQNWVGQEELTWNIPSWSVSAEFAAYLLFPVVVMVVRPIGGRLFSSLLVVALVLCLLNFFYAPSGFSLGKDIGMLGVVRCVTQFTIGAILARVFLTGLVTHRLIRPSLFILAALFLFIGLMTLESVMIPLAWAALVLAVALGDENFAFLNHRWLIFVGEISYATYMVHYFVRDIFKFALVRPDETTPLYYVCFALLTVFVASMPLYFLIERPAQRRLTAKVNSKRSDTSNNRLGCLRSPGTPL